MAWPVIGSGSPERSPKFCVRAARESGRKLMDQLVEQPEFVRAGDLVDAQLEHRIAGVARAGRVRLECRQNLPIARRAGGIEQRQAVLGRRLHRLLRIKSERLHLGDDVGREAEDDARADDRGRLILAFRLFAFALFRMLVGTDVHQAGQRAGTRTRPPLESSVIEPSASPSFGLVPCDHGVLMSSSSTVRDSTAPVTRGMSSSKSDGQRAGGNVAVAIRDGVDQIDDQVVLEGGDGGIVGAR